MLVFTTMPHRAWCLPRSVKWKGRSGFALLPLYCMFYLLQGDLRILEYLEIEENLLSISSIFYLLMLADKIIIII